RVARLAVVAPRDEQTVGDHRVEQLARHAGRRGEVVEGEELLGRRAALCRGRDGSREWLVGGVELAADEPSDEREREPAQAQLADARESLAVLRSVPRDA